MFKLDEKLAMDTVELDLWPLSQVRLMNDSNCPWVILVPARIDMRELHQLEPADRALLMDEIVRAAWALERMVTPHKMNVAALGNQVPQLHVHVIARFTTDPAWPRPIWGVAPPVPYTPEAIEDFKRRFAAAAQQ